jgi:hypothetical protein
MLRLDHDKKQVNHDKAGSLVRLGLKHAEEKNSPQFGSLMFPLQIISRG